MDELQTLIDKWDLILSTFKEEHEIIDEYAKKLSIKMA